MLIHDDQCIVAQCTPIGSGALALIRVCGFEVRLILSKFCFLASNKDLKTVESHTIHYGSILDDNLYKIDNVMFIVMDGPRTFTGQNTIEITCHNNQVIIETIIANIIKNGARSAQEGEFTRRAFLNGKIDLIQAESIDFLINANTSQALKASLAQIDGSLSNYMSLIESELIKVIAWCEASFEFLDEDVDHSIEVKALLLKIMEMVADIKRTYNINQHIRQGIKIALIGSVNAGKSSLFNSLLNQNRAIVTPIAGTTRDSIEGIVYKNGNYWTLIDTAGLRSTEDVIEQEGIKQSFKAAQNSDVIILVVDGSRNLNKLENEFYNQILESWSNKIIIVQSKSDLIGQSSMELNDISGKADFKSKEIDLVNKASIKVSSHTKENIIELESLIENKISELFEDLNLPFLINKRQYSLLVSLESKLINIIDMLNKNCQYELVSYHIKELLEDISEFTGKTISEAGLDKVFKEFCVGK